MTKVILWETTTDGRPIPIEPEARKQLHSVAGLPFVVGVRGMPDVHFGRGATVGSVIATKGAVIPAAVGVDLGCGMNAYETNLTASDLPDGLSNLRSAVEDAVPHGGPGVAGSWAEAGRYGAPRSVSTAWRGLEDRYRALADEFPRIGQGATIDQLGTLGGGNHFVELCLDEDNNVWVMLHSGSRGVGNRIGSYFIELAKEDMRTHHINLPDKDLAYLNEGTKTFNDYVKAVAFAQDFARVNRSVMGERVLSALSSEFGRTVHPTMNVISCHHNYLSHEWFGDDELLITRKGAINAAEGKMGIIPGSTGARSFIVEGKGNLNSYNSAPHGAGRTMSRTEAKRRFTVEDLAKATEGDECRKDAGVIDEIPSAYKDIDDVISASADLVTPYRVLKQFLCIKG